MNQQLPKVQPLTSAQITLLARAAGMVALVSDPAKQPYLTIAQLKVLESEYRSLYRQMQPQHLRALNPDEFRSSMGWACSLWGYHCIECRPDGDYGHSLYSVL